MSSRVIGIVISLLVLVLFAASRPISNESPSPSQATPQSAVPASIEQSSQRVPASSSSFSSSPSSSSSSSPSSSSASRRHVSDPAAALRLALQDDSASSSSSPPTLSDADVKRCIWNNPVLIKCASQWTRRALKELVREYNIQGVPESVTSVDAECESFVNGGALEKFARNEDGIASRYSFEFFGDSMTRGLFAAFVHGFDETAVPENKKVGFYLNRGPLFPPPILLPKPSLSSSSSSKKQQRGNDDMLLHVDIVADPISTPRRSFIVAPNMYEPIHDVSLFVTEEKTLISVDNNNSIWEVLSGIPKILRPIRGSLSSSASSSSCSTLRTMFRTDGGTSGNTSPRRDAVAKTADPNYKKFSYDHSISSAIPPNMWRSEILRSFSNGSSSKHTSSAVGGDDPSPLSSLFDFPDIVTNSDAPKIFVHTNVHPELAIGRVICESMRTGGAAYSAACKGVVDFNECIYPLPSAGAQAPRVRKGRPLTPTLIRPRRRQQQQQGVVESSSSFELVMRSSTKFGFTNAVEEQRIIEFLDSLWRYTLHQSSRRNVHFFPRLEVLQDCDMINDNAKAKSAFRSFYGPVCFALLIRQHQGKRLRKLFRYEMMRAAGLLSGGGEERYDESLSENQERYFVDSVDRDVLDPIRERWNASEAAFQNLVHRYPDGAYHMRNARNFLTVDVHVAARKYIREGLLAKMMSQSRKLALGRMARVMARNIQIDALSLHEIQPLCREQLAVKRRAPGLLGMCVAHVDPIHFNGKFNKMALEAVLAAISHFDHC